MRIESLKQFKKIVSAFKISNTSDIRLPFWNGACYMANVETVESFTEEYSRENFTPSKCHRLKARIRIELHPQYMCRLLYDVGQGYMNNMEGWHFPFIYEGIHFESSEYKVLGFEPVCGVLAITFELRLEYFQPGKKNDE